jgi:GntR family transcriptional regulator
VLKAYRELQCAGLLDSRAGVGTFVGTDITDASLAAAGPLHQELHRWLTTACRAGLDDETIKALVGTTLDCVRSECSG